MFLVRAINFVISLQNGLYVAVDCTALSHPPSISINSFLVTCFPTGLALSLLLPFKAIFINFQKHSYHTRRAPQKQLIFLFPNLFQTKNQLHPSSNRALIAFLGTHLVRTTSLNFPNSSILKLRNFCVFSLEAHTTLLAVKRTHPVLSLSPFQRDYQFVVCSEKHT